MSEKNLMEEMLKHQRKIDAKLDDPGARELALEADKLMLEKVLEAVESPEEAKMIQDAFDEYVRVENELYEEKSDEMIAVDDIRKKIPDNYWLKLVHTNKEAPVIDFDAVWKNIQENVDFDEIKREVDQDDANEARKKGQIN